MKTVTRPLNEITQHATRLLYKELGVVNTIRFLNQFTTGYGDYTKEREQLFEDLSLDEIVSEIKQMKEK
ncbi:MAG: hypothetical protein ACE5IY_16995 [bacterium]